MFGLVDTNVKIGDHVWITRDQKDLLALVESVSQDGGEYTVLINTQDTSLFNCIHEEAVVTQVTPYHIKHNHINGDERSNEATGWFNWIEEREAKDKNIDEYFENLSVIYKSSLPVGLSSPSSFLTVEGEVNYLPSEGGSLLDNKSKDETVSDGKDSNESISIDQETVIEERDCTQETMQVESGPPTTSPSRFVGDARALKKTLLDIEESNIPLSRAIISAISKALEGTLLYSFEHLEDFVEDSMNFLQTHYCKINPLEQCQNFCVCLLRILRNIIEGVTDLDLQKLKNCFRVYDILNVFHSVIRYTHSPNSKIEIEVLELVTSILHKCCRDNREISSLLLHTNDGITFWSMISSYGHLLTRLSSANNNALLPTLNNLAGLIYHMFDCHSIEIREDVSLCFTCRKKSKSLMKSITHRLQISNRRKKSKEYSNLNVLKKELITELPELLESAVSIHSSPIVVRLIRRAYLIVGTVLDLTNTMIEMVIQVKSRDVEYAENVLYSLNSLSSVDSGIIQLAIRHFIVKSLKKIAHTCLTENKLEECKSLILLILQLSHVHNGFKRRVQEDMSDLLAVKSELDTSYILANQRQTSDFLNRVMSLHASQLSLVEPPTHTKSNDRDSGVYDGTLELESYDINDESTSCKES